MDSEAAKIPPQNTEAEASLLGAVLIDADAIVKIVYHIPEGKTDRVDLTAVQRACVQAMYVVGIFPVHAVVQRERRAALKIDMDFTTLLTRYFESKELLSQRKAALIKKAFDLKHAQNEGTAE